jgi:hypothetical protein
MNKTLLQIVVLAALVYVAYSVVQAGYALFMFLYGPVEGSGRLPWFILVQWGHEAACLGAVGYFLSRPWAVGFGVAYAALRYATTKVVWYGEPDIWDFLSTYGNYVLALLAVVAGATYAPPKRIQHAA